MGTPDRKELEEIWRCADWISAEVRHRQQSCCSAFDSVSVKVRVDDQKILYRHHKKEQGQDQGHGQVQELETEKIKHTLP